MRNPQPSALPGRENDPKALRLLRWTLLLLVLELTFEGLARKLNIAGSNIAIFVLKDVIVAALGIQVARLKRPPAIDFLWIAYLVEMVLFLPLIFMTATHDLVLAVFGAKEYLLYPVVAFAMFIGFEKSSTREIVAFFRWLALLVLPTGAIAILQLRLPPTHWLNLSVDGASLEGFSAGGHLRVSSTFSFVAQYAAFLNAEVFMTMIALNSLKDVKWIWRMFYFLIVPTLIVSSYVTGSRSAVLANCAIIAIAAGLSLMKFQSRNTFRMVLIIGGLVLTLVAAKFIMPDAFEGYSTREQGQLVGASAEIQERIWGQMFGWTSDLFTTPMFGYGLGIMSNGSQMLSSYAYTQRAFTWTETDFASTLFEGGIYLILVWYGFRYFVIYQVFRRFMSIKSGELALPGAFCLGFIVIIGFTATLGIQPPIAIWWWLAVGTSLLIWSKCAEPVRTVLPDEKTPPSAPLPQAKLRGQSAYSERLHAKK